MKLRILILMALLPVVTMGQQMGTGSSSEPKASVVAFIAEPAGVATDDTLSAGPANNTPDPDFAPASMPGPHTGLAQNGASSQTSSAGGEIKRPTTGGSMVGYIDDAIVESQVVVRFEADIKNITPDLAEFAYAKCDCGYVPPGLGPPGLASNLNAEALRFYGEYALNKRFSLFAEIPLRFVQPQASATPAILVNQNGLSDVSAGFKFALLASSRQYLTAEFQSSFPSGDASRWLGTNHYSMQPSLLYYRQITERFALESEFGDLHPIDGSPGFSPTGPGGFSGDVIDYGVGPSYKLYAGKRVQFTPVIELVGWRILGGFVTEATSPAAAGLTSPCKEMACSADGRNIVNLKFGARTNFGDHSSIYAGYGQALTGLYWYLRIFRLEYRYSF